MAVSAIPTLRQGSLGNLCWCRQNMLQTVKKLDHKVSRASAGLDSHTPGRTPVRRVKAHRDRPSNSMASRIVLPPQDRVISSEEMERLQAKEKAHLADLQVCHLLFFDAISSNARIP